MVASIGYLKGATPEDLRNGFSPPLGLIRNCNAEMQIRVLAVRPILRSSCIARTARMRRIHCGTLLPADGTFRTLRFATPLLEYRRPMPRSRREFLFRATVFPAMNTES